MNQKAILSFLGIMTVIILMGGCRRVDTSNSTGMATKPSDLFSTDSKKRCYDRAGQLALSSSQQTTLCERATSSAPVDCFKKKTGQGVSADAAISQCRSPDRPN